MAAAFVVMLCGVLVVGAVYSIKGVINSNDPDYIRSQLNACNSQISSIDSTIEIYRTLKEYISQTEEKLFDVRRNFLDGGYVCCQKELAKEEISACLHDTTYAGTNLDAVIMRLEDRKKPLLDDKRSIETHLAKVLEAQSKKS